MENLVVIADTYPPKKDGVLTYLRSVLPLLKNKYHITLIAPKFTDNAEPLMDGINVVLTPCIPIDVANYYPAIPTMRLARHIRKADIVFVHDLAPLGSVGLNLAYLLRKPIGLFCHHDESIMLSRAFRLETKRLVPRIKIEKFIDSVVLQHYKRSSVIFVATHRFYEKLRRLRIPEDRIIYAPFAVDTARFTPNRNNVLREKLGIPKDAKVILNLGRMSHEKNVETVIKSVPEVMKKIENAYYVFAGGGPRLDYYRELAAKLSPPGRIIFTDWVEWEETPKYYAMADVFVFPSLHETQAFVIMEAMASSLPVIVPAEPESSFSYYKGGENCLFLEDNKDPHELAQKIIRVLTDEKMRIRLGEKARQKMESYSWEEHITKLLEGFERAKFNRRPSYRRRISRLRGIAHIRGF
jgi:1,2-diacylglycerol 3-alpha-glucosyltransferase